MPKYQIQTRLANDEWECTEEFPTIFNSYIEAFDELQEFCDDCKHAVDSGFLEDFNPEDWRLFEIMEDEMPKEFECFWGAGYRDDNLKSTLAYHPVEFFSIDNGYDPKDIKNIRNLHVGEGYDLNGVFCEHWTRRIK